MLHTLKYALVGLLACGSLVTDGDGGADASDASAESNSTDAALDVDAANCGPETCDWTSEYCYVFMSGAHPDAAEYACVVPDGGGSPNCVCPTFSGQICYGDSGSSAPCAGCCGCYEADGEVTITFCAP